MNVIPPRVHARDLRQGADISELESLTMRYEQLALNNVTPDDDEPVIINDTERKGVHHFGVWTMQGHPYGVSIHSCALTCAYAII